MQTANAARDRQITLACGLCANSPTLDRLSCHPILDIVIPDNPTRPRGRGVRRLEHKGMAALEAGGPLYAAVDAHGRVDGRSYRERAAERGAGDQVLTYRCPAGHEHRLAGQRLAAAMLAALERGRRKVLAGVDL